MKTCFVDTNLFVRYLTNDDSEKADRVEALLNEATGGEIKLITSDLVLAELIWVLESSYDLKPAAITPMIRSILTTPGLEVINGAIVGRALEIYQDQNVDFVDGHIAALAEKLNISEIYSFDKKHLSRIESIKRIEP
ncbi:MAG: type II toxin-antitoxin system VapC family toxin [Syntrophales bacterium]|jgi:predicted nucleic acid-binding protein|nr:type II toxin-antitoxin system VapC family toxin [Syntrophales bacterium]MCK9391871.1 type II toxin-antitoxin system VapC family toxin [Syntrophales bacterium]